MTSPAPLYHYRYTYHHATLYLLPKPTPEPVAMLPAWAASAHDCAECGDTGIIPMSLDYSRFRYCGCCSGDLCAWSELERDYDDAKAAQWYAGTW